MAYVYLTTTTNYDNAYHYFTPSDTAWDAPKLALLLDGTAFYNGGTFSLQLSTRVTCKMADGGQTTAGSTFTANCTATGTRVQVGSTWYTMYLIPFSEFSGLMTYLSGGSALSWSSLLYDRVELTVAGTLTSGTTTTTLPKMLSAYISRLPEYTVTGIDLDTPDSVLVEYTTTTGWDRPDEELHLRGITVNGGAVASKNIVKRGVMGYAYGQLEIPVARLAPHTPAVGDTIGFTLEGEHNILLAQVSQAIGNSIECDTPDMVTAVSDGLLSVTCTKSGDKSYQGDELYSVSIGGQYPCDTVTGTEGETVALYPPLDTELTVYATGYSEDGDISAQTSGMVTIPSGGNLYIDDMQGGTLTMRYNQKFGDDRDADMELVKLARPLPSAFFGTGCSDASVTVSGTVLRSEQDADSFRQLAGSIRLLRFPGGDRRLVAVRSVSVNTRPAYWEISLKCAEVSA